jgi:diaminobutyrate-2-oxoglutarate transaminase
VTPADGGLASQIARRAFDHGVVIETSGANDEVLKILPALTIDDHLLMRGMEVIECSVAEILAEQAKGARVLKFGGPRR